MGTIDLHTHTTASDGSLTPEALVQLAAQRGLRILAITDHDTVAGLSAAEAIARQYGVTLIPGIELSTAVPSGEVHILGYFIDPSDPGLQRHLVQLVEARRERAIRLVEQLRRLGFPVTLEDLEAIAGGGTMTRAHAARLLVARGFVQSIDEAFERYLGRNRPAYVPRTFPTPQEAVEIVRSAGGIPVLAHPLSASDLETTLEQLLAVGLMGLEAWYAEYPPATQRALAQRATELGLLTTGGSDYHGPGFRAARELGSVEIPLAAVRALFARAGRQFPDDLATLPDQKRERDSSPETA